jgi:hypothetical protein
VKAEEMRVRLRTPALPRRKAEHLVLQRPCGRKVGEAGDTHSMGQPPIDGRLDEIRGEEGKRNRHIHFPDATILSLCDVVRGCGRVNDQFTEPTASAGNGGDQGSARFQTHWTSVVGLDSGAKCNRAKQTGFARLCQAL